MTADAYVSLWLRCDETVRWKNRDKSVLEDIRTRRMVREVELDQMFRLAKEIEVDEDFEDWYG